MNPAPTQCPPSAATLQLLELLTYTPRRRVASALFDCLSQNPSISAGAALDQVTARLAHKAASQPPPSARLDTRGMCVLGFFDDAFPQCLREIPDPPLVLYVQGEVRNLQSRCIAIVGARRCTRAGAAFAQQLAYELSAAGVCIVSGLALGIDAAAHRGCLEARGSTIAFLGSGFDQTYPAMNRQLATEIVQHEGTLVSEYAPPVAPRRHHFPERNRLLSGSSCAVVVVEATTSSGSLISARLALEQGRDVFAVPGPVNSLVSAGCHRLLQQGAGLITSAADVLQELGLTGEPGADRPTQHLVDQASAAARQLYAQLSGYPMTLDEVCAGGGLEAAQALVLLSELELIGIVSQGSSGYIRTS